MSIRFCVYRGCENYSVNGIIIGDYTIFQFPKDPEKQQKWIDLGKVPHNFPKKDLYMCSEHFDKKYLSINSRRTILVGNAVPFPFKGNIDDANDDTNMVDCSKDDILDDEDDDDDDDDYGNDNEYNEQNEEHNIDVNEKYSEEEAAEELEILNASFQRQFNRQNTDDEQDGFDDEKNIKFELHVEDGFSPGEDNENENYIVDPIDAKRTRRSTKRNYKYSSSEKSLSLSPTRPRDNKKNNNKRQANYKHKQLLSPSPPTSPAATSLPIKKYSNKRKLNIDEHSRSPSPAIKMSKTNNQESKNYFSKKLRKTTAEVADEITEYVYKNVYWIKMPKDVYIKEKNFFLGKIKKYEMLLNSLKTQIEQVDL